MTTTIARIGCRRCHAPDQPRRALCVTVSCADRRAGATWRPRTGRGRPLDEPDERHLLALHYRLVEGDLTAAAELADLLLPYLQWKLTGLAYRWRDPELVQETIDMSLTRYILDPARFDPRRGKLVAYLVMDVTGDVRHAGQRRAREVVDSEVVELQQPAGNTSVEEEVLDALDPFDQPPAVVAAARRALQAFSETDRALAQLIADGVRPTAPYAALLGIAHLPLAEQRAAVKRNKDRIAKKLERLRAQLV